VPVPSAEAFLVSFFFLSFLAIARV
jgi:hypothetical protein